MIIKSLRLKNFRNYESVAIEFAKGLNIICGQNGAGKTNLVEAIHYLSLARSFRTNENSDLIAHDKESATIEAVVIEGVSEKNIKIVINGEKRQVSVGRREIKKLSELTELADVIVFEPRDVNLFQATPKNRRTFIDVHLSKNSRVYLRAITRYEKLHNERNEILKNATPDLIHLDVVTDMLIEESEKIVNSRQEYLTKLEPMVNRVIKAISPKTRKVVLEYQPFIAANEKQFIEAAKNAFKKSLENDLRKKVTNIGIHREDFSTTLNGHNIALFGSQGEKRMVALALKVAPYFLIEDKDKRPIIVLDDALSELDQEHARHLLEFFMKFEQVFITGTKIEENNASFYEVVDRNIVRRLSHGT